MFSFLPTPIHEFITDHRLGGPMIILIGLFLIWLFTQSLYLLRFLSKRFKILRALRLGKSKIRIANPFWFFGFPKDKVDFYLLNGENTYAIKVLGAFRPGIEFCFINETEYYRQRHIVLGYNMLMLPCGYGRKETLPNIDFTYRCEDFGIDRKQITPVLLWNPSAYCISLRQNPNVKNPSAIYHTGDYLYDKLLMDSRALRKLLK